MSADCWCRWHIDLAGVGGEADGRIDVADLADRVADEAIDHGSAEVGLGGDLAGHDGQVGGDQGFAGHPAERVGCQAVVEDGVADLVGHLVGMAHRHGFAGEQVSVRTHGSISSMAERENGRATVGRLSAIIGITR